MLTAISGKSRRLPQYREVIDLYRRAFPPEERLPLWHMRLMALRRDVGFRAWLDDGALVGLTYTVDSPATVWLFYLAVNDSELLEPVPSEPAPCGAKEAVVGETKSGADRDAELPAEDRSSRLNKAGLAVAGPRALMKVKPAAPAEAGERTSAEVAGGTEADEAAPEPAEDEAKKPRKRRSTARKKPKDLPHLVRAGKKS